MLFSFCQLRCFVSIIHFLKLQLFIIHVCFPSAFFLFLVSLVFLSMSTSIQTLKSNAVRLLDQGQPSSALPLADILCELQPNTESQLLRASVLMEVRDYDGVLRAVKSVIKNDPVNDKAIFLGMKASFELADVKECSRFAEQLHNLNEGNVNAMCYIGKCAELSGDTEKAVKSYQSALKVDPFCGEAIDSLIDRRLLDAAALNAVIDSLTLPVEAEALRSSYKARINSTSDCTEVQVGLPRKLVLLQNARAEHEKNNLRQALSLTTELLQYEPYDRDAVCLHLSILVDMKASPKLFEMAHFLSKSKAHAELAVYAIGCFYFSLSNFERAGRYFSRATELDCFFSEAWIAYGHCYAKLEEGEQALNVYRRSMSFFPGLHSCAVYVGMQYSRIHQWPIAMCFLEEALKKSPNDTLVLNEIGVLYARTQKLNEALHFFREAFNNLSNPENPSEHRDCIVFNLATMLRKLGEFNEAISYYTEYVRCRPNASHGYCALGFTFHLAGSIKLAIANYHTALSIKNDSFCRDMLDRALAADFGQNVGGNSWGQERTYGSVSPADVSFSTVSRTLRSESTVEESTFASPRPSVGRSLNF
ncbi:anaphase-promoting complex subunit 6 [Strigomonas culicis]|uniref:Anaphase-promoting complex subunit 6 n=1 Tax=Strigomonas culicis TaxID=28005 RepID=S9VMS4_9TRYP|nr:anaphase-promoting complex subunit 6 [Strigomonas culicis]|eukprot:EPY28481.1 anaphase-promoting complex subunit 6 [Strigomonas culicis]